MKLLTKEIMQRIPALYAQDGKGEAATVHVKFFNPCGSGTWLITEATAYMQDGSEKPLAEVENIDAPEVEDIRMFGLCHIQEAELGYVSFRELQALRLPLGLKIERDKFFSPCPLSEARKREGL